MKTKKIIDEIEDILNEELTVDGDMSTLGYAEWAETEGIEIFDMKPKNKVRIFELDIEFYSDDKLSVCKVIAKDLAEKIQSVDKNIVIEKSVGRTERFGGNIIDFSCYLKDVARIKLGKYADLL